MIYRLGDVDMQGTEPSNVIHAAFTPKVVDGGKARFHGRRAMRFASIDMPRRDVADDLIMDHVDPASSQYVVPHHDCG